MCARADILACVKGAGCPGGCAGAGYPDGVCSYEIFWRVQLRDILAVVQVCVCGHEIKPGFFSPLLDLM